MAHRSLFLSVLLAFLAVFPVSVSAADPYQKPDEAIANLLGDQTLRIDDPKRGLRVEYVAKDGRVFRWVPGKARVTVGRWTGKVLQFTNLVVNGQQLRDRSDVRFCYQRDTGRTTSSGAPVILKVGCRFWGQSTDMVVEQMDGDPLGLSRGVIPCRFCDRDTPFAEMSSGLH